MNTGIVKACMPSISKSEKVYTALSKLLALEVTVGKYFFETNSKGL
jgi:hypothetical protein